jgi:hypothetical protein
MARRTIGQAARVLQVVKMIELLQFCRRQRFGVAHRKHFAQRPHMLRRVAMASQAPLHFQRRCAPQHRHLVDPAMAFDAGHALVDMDAVIEIDEIRQVMHPIPADRLLVPIARVQRRQRRRITEQLRMAGQADLRRRQAGEGRFFNRGMAIAAIQAVIADMVLVAEPDRLRDRSVLLVFGRHVPFDDSRGGADQEQDCDKEQLDRKNSSLAKRLRHKIF